MTQRTPFGLVFVLWLAGLCAAAQFAKVSLIFPELQTLYPGHGSTIGFLVTLLSFIGMVLGLFTGMIVARFGFRKPLLVALVMGGVLSLMQALLPPFPLMLASRFVEGMSHLLIVVAAPTMIARISSDQHRSFTMTLWGTFFGVAFAIVGVFGLPLVKSNGIAALYIVHGLAMFAVAAALHFMLPTSEVQASAASDLAFRDVMARHIETYRSPHMSAAAFGWLFYTLSFVSYLTVLPSLMPEAERSFAATTMSLAGIVASMIIGVALLRWMSAVAVIQIGFVLSGLCVLGFWLFPGSVWVPITLFATLGLVQGASFAAVPQLNPTPRGQSYANGAMAQMGNLGNLSGTVILLWLHSSLGQAGLIGFGLVCYVAGLTVHMSLARLRR